MTMKRSSGILLSVSALPSPYGIGTLGKAAYDFADFLHAAGQKYWQLLPMGPTSYGDSPYQSFSTYAGNPYFIDLDLLIADGLLTQEEVDKRNWGTNPRYVDYAQIYRIIVPKLPGSCTPSSARSSGHVLISNSLERLLGLRKTPITP